MEILIMLMPFLMQWLEKCQENRSRKSIEAGLNKPGIREWFVLRSVIKDKKSLHGKQLRKATKEAFEALSELEPEDVQQIMAEVPMLED